jgi:hypothetical protein
LVALYQCGHFRGGAYETDRTRNLRSGRAVASIILIVDDDASLAASVSRVLRNAGAKHVVASTSRHRLDEIETAEVDLILVDMSMSLTDPLHAIAELRRRAPEVPIVAASGPGLSPPPGLAAPTTAEDRRDLVTVTRLVPAREVEKPS